MGIRSWLSTASVDKLKSCSSWSALYRPVAAFTADPRAEVRGLSLPPHLTAHLRLGSTGRCWCVRGSHGPRFGGPEKLFFRKTTSSYNEASERGEKATLVKLGLSIHCFSDLYSRYFCFPLKVRLFVFNIQDREFPGRPVIRILSFHWRGYGFGPWSGN